MWLPAKPTSAVFIICINGGGINLVVFTACMIVGTWKYRVDVLANLLNEC